MKSPFDILVEIKKHIDEAFTNTECDKDDEIDISVIRDELIAAALLIQDFLPQEYRDWKREQI